jgi:hypothetical protein
MPSLDIKIDKNFRALELGLLEGGNPSAYKRLLSFASLNAARTMTKPMKAEAPKGRTGNLIKSIRAKSGRYNRPSGVVGPLFGAKSSPNRPYYRHFVTSGVSGVRQTKSGPKAVKPIAANPFVMRVANAPANQQRAIEAFYKTIEAFYNDQVFRGRILRFKRGNQR